MKKVLFIAYYFPPIGGSGTQRPVKFVKYLPQFGWRPYVISTDQPYGDGSEGRDETLLTDIPADVQVWRVPTPQPQPVQRLARWVGWKSATTANTSSAIAASNPTRAPRLSIATRLRRALLAPLYLVERPPVDPALYWALRVVPLARRIIAQEGIDAVLTTMPPWSALVVGRLLQRFTGRPWVADFRDPWTDNTFIYFPSPAQRWFDERLERYLINHANAVISVTTPCLEGLRQKASISRRNKPFRLIPNGWDRADFPKAGCFQPLQSVPAASKGHMVLLHPGSAYEGEPIPILRALEWLETSIVDRLCFRFVGHIDLSDRAKILNSPYARCFQLDSQRVPHPEVLRLMHESHILLLLRKGPDASSGKIFEYMVASRPVVAIGTGVAEQLVKECGIGCTISPDEPDKLAAVLRHIALDYEGFVQEYYQPHWEAINQYERSILTEKLARVLEGVTQPK